MQRFKDRTVVVTGGSSGIGLALAKAFASEGARVMVAGRVAAKLAEAVGEINGGAEAFVCDIADIAQVGSLFEQIRARIREIDVLCVNAGVLSIMSIEAVTEAEWDRVQGVNLKGAFFTVQKALPMMSNGGSIVMIGSTAGRQGIPSASVYSATKAGLRSLGRAFAAELMNRGIRVNVVSPGPVDTPIFEHAGGVNLESVPSLRKVEMESVPMKRMGAPMEVAAAVLFLASDAATFVTGVELLVDGGAASF